MRSASAGELKRAKRNSDLGARLEPGILKSACELWHQQENRNNDCCHDPQQRGKQNCKETLLGIQKATNALE